MTPLPPGASTRRALDLLILVHRLFLRRYGDHECIPLAGQFPHGVTAEVNKAPDRCPVPNKRRPSAKRLNMTVIDVAAPCFRHSSGRFRPLPSSGALVERASSEGTSSAMTTFAFCRQTQFEERAAASPRALPNALVLGVSGALFGVAATWAPAPLLSCHPRQPRRWCCVLNNRKCLQHRRRAGCALLPRVRAPSPLIVFGGSSNRVICSNGACRCAATPRARDNNYLLLVMRGRAVHHTAAN